MKFHEYRPIDAQKGWAQTQARYQYIYEATKYNKNAIGGDYKYFAVEWNWMCDRRPYYNVYPSIVKALQRTSLDVTLNQLSLKPGSVSICFAEGHEPVICDEKFGTAPVFAMLLETGTVTSGTDRYAEIVAYRRQPDGKSVHTILKETNGERLLSSSVVSDGENEQIDGLSQLLSIAIGVAMLAREREFTEPILLRRDQGKDFKTTEEIERAIERAIRNGVNGKVIGKDLESMPYIRRPHFYMKAHGPQWSLRTLDFRKGAICNKDKVYPIPTGYLDDKPAS